MSSAIKGAIPALKQLLSDAGFNGHQIIILNASVVQGGPDDTRWSSVRMRQMLSLFLKQFQVLAKNAHFHECRDEDTVPD